MCSGSIRALLGARFLAPVAALAVGAVQTLAYTHTALWPLPLLALALLVAQLDRASRRRAALLGWCYGTAWLVAGVWWLYISMHRYGGLPAALSALAVLALCGFLSLYLAAAAAAYAHWRRGRGGDALLFGALFLLAELARGVLFTGFPWVAAGYSQVDSPLAALAPWVGVYGIGAWMAVAAASLVLLARRRAWRPAALAVGIALAAAELPGRFTAPVGEFSVTLLQTDVKQNEKFALDHMAETLAWVAQQLLDARTGLVVAPETAVPLLPAQLDEFAPGYWAALRQRFDSGGRAALVGLPLGDFDHGYTNSVAGLAAGPVYRYDKRHLVPFGEFIPWGFRWFTDLMNIPLGDFARGVANPPLFAVLGQRLAPNICYEDLFGEALARRFADAATAPTAFVNVSNIGWFGDTEAIPQHLNISRLRALEFQRPMLRSTNTGATAIVDYRGAVVAELAPYTRGVLRGRVQGRTGITPYAWWASRAGLWPLGLAALGVLAWAAWGRRSRPRERFRGRAPADPAG
ncbi:MAG: apolipoprotein N-acyltransferase [Burkholderiales bacterium]|nr:apolipoprotein N-acyltransferase [Burkholderiales bacterium]